LQYKFRCTSDLLFEIRVEIEHVLCDPKVGDLRVGRVKSKETLMEAHNGSDVQIDRVICVKGRKTHRTDK